MTKKKNIRTLIEEHKTLIIIIGVVLFLIELEIFAVAAMKSGRKARINVLNSNGDIIYEADGKNLSEFNKYYFEQTFGPLDKYNIKLVSQDMPFPFRAWFVAAVGIPVGVVLLLGFVFKAYLTFFTEQEEQTPGHKSSKQEYHTVFDKIVGSISRLNIFIIGFLVFLTVFAYWVIPNFFSHVGTVGLELIIRYKWFFLSAILILLGLFVWIIYLKYLLAKKNIERQSDLEKYRLELEYHHNINSVQQTSHQLEYKVKNIDKPEEIEEIIPLEQDSNDFPKENGNSM